jgi:hypothetical protein
LAGLESSFSFVRELLDHSVVGRWPARDADTGLAHEPPPRIFARVLRRNFIAIRHYTSVYLGASTSDGIAVRPVEPESSVVPGTLDTVHPPHCLHDDDVGRWRVTTQTSAHLINLDRRTATRIDGNGVPSRAAGYTVSALRRDRESVELIELVRCEVGAEMELLLRVRDDCVTGRRTTAVVSITPAEE